MNSNHEDGARMKDCLERLNIPLQIVWRPDKSKNVHGEIEQSSRTIFIYDMDESQAWETLLHEALEWKLRDVTKVYRETINGLIEIIEKLSYREKEKFLESVPTIFRMIEDVKKIE